MRLTAKQKAALGRFEHGPLGYSLDMPETLLWQLRRKGLIESAGVSFQLGQIYKLTEAGRRALEEKSK